MPSGRKSRSAEVERLRARSAQLFTDLLSAEYPSTRRGKKAAATRAMVSPRTGRPTSFSWFDPEDAAKATALAAELAVVTGAQASVEAGLSSALDLAEERASEDPPALVRQALAMFVTHHKPARRLGKPRSVTARPEAFRPSRVGTTGGAAGGRGKPPGRGGKARTLGSTTEAQLDYWREDALANEHHEHWHEVYPFSGLFPADWNDWAQTADRRGLAALLQALEPRPGNQWLTFVQSRPAAEIANAFLSRANALAQQGRFGQFLAELTAEPYRALLRLNDRQGELFIYMHRQMLARYDAERLSAGLRRVRPFGPPFTSTPPDGYDPAPLPNYLPRPSRRKLAATSSTQLVQLQQELADAVEALQFDGTRPAGVRIDRTNLGEALEAADPRLRAPLRAGRYVGLHNIGHGRIAGISVPTSPDDPRRAVMNDPMAAIRDPIFWRWHKNIDDLAFTWEELQPVSAFNDLPAVRIRDGLDGDASTPWLSPDLYLVGRTRATESSNAVTRIKAALSGTNADRSVTDRAVPSLSGYRFTSELSTQFRTRRLAGSQVTYLTHLPFGYAVRIANSRAANADVTLRVFVVPAELADERRAWIEWDKVAVTIPRQSTTVVYRSDLDFSVLKRPAETDPGTVEPGDDDPNDDGYCDCGWPWSLLLPRGRPDGMPFRMMAICTSAAIDRVPQPTQCGSMSFCGAVDRYPDTRDMGYPFARPLTQSLTDTIVSLGPAAGRSFTIKHLGTA